MKKTTLTIMLLVFTFLSSCRKFNKSDELDYVTNIQPEEITELNKIIIDEKIVEYIPINLKSDEELSDYIISSDESFDELNLKMFKLLDVVSEFKKEKDAVHKIDNSDASSVGKGALNLGKMLAKGVWSGGKTLLSSSFLFDYKKDYIKFKETSNKKKLDSLKYVMHYISINNLFDDEFNIKQTELINTSKSVWSINQIPDNIINKLDFEESLDLYKKLKLESNRVIKVLLFNKMKGNNCAIPLNNQVEDLKSFWNSQQQDYRNDAEILKDYFKLLSHLKTNISQREKDIESNKNNYNEKIVSNLNNFVSIYNTAILQNINDLNIYERIPAAEREIKKKISAKSDVYFE